MSSCYFLAALILAMFNPISTNAHTHHCSEAFSLLTLRRNISHCKRLTTLGAEFGWNYHNNQVVEIFMGTRLESDVGWLAWGVNPQHKPQMVGTRALIGLKQSNGSLVIETYNITWETKLGCRLRPSKIDVGVDNMKFEYLGEIKYYIIHATVVLPPSYNVARLNHVWQVGYKVNEWEPLMHDRLLQNMDSSETINLTTGVSRSVGGDRYHLRMVHGILDIVGWGTLVPMGVIISRYFRRYPVRFKLWFWFHVSCQSIGYIIGTIGWVIGLYLGHASGHYSFRIHGLLATFIFTFTTIQMLALLFRPRRTDDYRKYWNMYHHFLGYALLALIIVNIFRGINILKPDHTWKWAYIIVLGVLAFIALILEVYTWIKFVVSKTTPDPSCIRPSSSTHPNNRE